MINNAVARARAATAVRTAAIAKQNIETVHHANHEILAQDNQMRKTL